MTRLWAARARRLLLLVLVAQLWGFCGGEGGACKTPSARQGMQGGVLSEKTAGTQPVCVQAHGFPGSAWPGLVAWPTPRGATLGAFWVFCGRRAAPPRPVHPPCNKSALLTRLSIFFAPASGFVAPSALSPQSPARPPPSCPPPPPASMHCVQAKVDHALTTACEPCLEAHRPARA